MFNRNGIFRNNTSLVRFHYPLNLQSVDDIDAGHFTGCTNLTSVEIQEGVTALPPRLFRYAASLTQVTLPATLESIGDEAFRGCTGLTELDIPDRLQKIGKQAFFGCTGLTELDLPGTVTFLDYRAFYQCSALTRIYIPLQAALGRELFKGTPSAFEIWTEYGADAVTYAQDNNHHYYYLSLTGDHMPKGTVYRNVRQNPYGWIRSTVPVQSVAAQVRDASGQTVRSFSASPGKGTYSLAGNCSNALSVETLPLGTYTLILSASTNKSSEMLISRTFTVKEAPFIAELTGFSPFMTFGEVGSPLLVKGTLKANYPLTKVTVSAVPDEGETLTWSAAPNTKEYSLSEMGINLNTFPVGSFTFYVTAEGHGESKHFRGGTSLVSPLMGQEPPISDEEKMNRFISNADNELIFVKRWAGIGSMKIRVVNHVDNLTSFCMFLSNYQSYLDVVFNDALQGKFSNHDDSFYVKLAKGEIKALLQDFKQSDIEDYEDSSLVNQILDVIQNGKDAYFNAAESEYEWLRWFIDLFNELDDGTISSRLGLCSDVLEVFRNYVINYVGGMRLLDSIENKYSNNDVFARCYQVAVADLREQFRSWFSNMLGEFLDFIRPKLIDEAWDWAMETLAGFNPIGWANLIYNLAGNLGAYDDADECITYMLQVESYYAAEKNYREAFMQVYNGDRSEQAVRKLRNRYNFTLKCGLRSVYTLMGMKEANYRYMDSIGWDELVALRDSLQEGEDLIY